MDFKWFYAKFKSFIFLQTFNILIKYQPCFKGYMYFLKADLQREMKRKRERSTDFLFKWLTLLDVGHSWVRILELPLGFLPGCRNPNTSALLCYFLRHIGREDDQKWNIWDLNGFPFGMPALHTVRGLTHCAMELAPKIPIKTLWPIIEFYVSSFYSFLDSWIAGQKATKEFLFVTKKEVFVKNTWTWSGNSDCVLEYWLLHGPSDLCS